MVRGTSKRRLLSRNPKCIYCGGGTASSTWDHMPNKGMFPKDRPAGLEFPSCNACNQGSKWFEDVASFVGSIQLPPHDDEQANEHFKIKLNHLLRVHPDIYEELQPTFRQMKQVRKLEPEGGTARAALNLQGPAVSLALKLYGAKLGLALHWAETKEILPKDKRVGVFLYSNEVHYDGGVPQHLFEMLPNQKMLKQGVKSSAYPFLYSSGKATDTNATAHWACFSNAFMYCLFVGGAIDFSMLPPDLLFSPGCLQTPKPRPVATRVGWGIGPIIAL